jgi:hypothetical protein
MKHVAHLGSIIAIAVAFYFLMVFVEGGYVINEYVVTPPDVPIEDWTKDFETWAGVGMAMAVLGALGWYVLGQWTYKINEWSQAGKRVAWGVLALLSSSGVVLGIIFTKPAQENRWMALAFYLLNWLLIYYLATLFFSPLSFKYTPVGARRIRRWNLAF